MDPAPSTPSDAQRQLVVFAREIREMYRQERARSRELEAALARLGEASLSTMKALAALVEAKDPGTRMHLDRTNGYGMALTRLVAPELASAPDMSFGFLLHDIGKVGIPEGILSKPGALDEREWAVMRTHPVVGARIVEPLQFLERATEVVLGHHERVDGNGYPHGLKGDDIPLAARVFSVVDAFDAMTTDRPYRRAFATDRAVEEIVRGSGTQFDSEVVEAFLILVDGNSN